MKKGLAIKNGFALISLLIFIFGAAVIFLLISFLQHNCRSTKTFSVGAVDPRFKISEQEVQNIAIEAANQWNSQSGGYLLKYEQSASLKIDLIYDDRQAEVDKLNSATASLEKNRNSVLTSKEKFDQMLISFQKDLSAYDKEVSLWNKKGGAPEDVYNRLEATRISLNGRRDQLISMSKALNLQTENYNSGLQSLQDTLDSRKNIIITQGLYTPGENKIEIFTFGNADELRLVLMHELGHSIGLDHGQDQMSIMYYLLGNQDLTSPRLTEEDKTMLEGRCSAKKPKLYESIFDFFPSAIN